MKTPEILTTLIHECDSYKHGHLLQYPENLTRIYVNFTPRSGRDPNSKGIIFFGLQYFLQVFEEMMQENFFKLPWQTLVDEIKGFYLEFYGTETPQEVLTKFEQLHKARTTTAVLQFNALKEGTFVPYGVPCVTVTNIDPNLAWFVTFIETWFSCEIWHSCTSATTAANYRNNFLYYARTTSDQEFMVDFQGHDFSLRGHTSMISGTKSGAGHCLSFSGSDSCPVIPFVKRYYPGDNGLVATSVPSTEHSVMCANVEWVEEEYFVEITYDNSGNIIKETEIPYDLYLATKSDT